MAKCNQCGIEIALLTRGKDGMCKSCTKKNDPAEVKKKDLQEQAAQDQAALVEAKAKREKVVEASIDAVLVSTETTLDGLKVNKRLGIVTAECAYGINVFKDLFASVRNLVGGRSEAVQSTMRDARETVLNELKREGFSRGANAVIAVDLDYTQIGDGSSTMVLLVASGTAVVVSDNQ